MLGPGLLIIGFFFTTVFVVYHTTRSRHLENMAKIEHGMEPKPAESPMKIILNLGIFLSFLGTGLFIAYVLEEYTNIPYSISIPGCLLLAGGIALIASYLFSNKQRK